MLVGFNTTSTNGSKVQKQGRNKTGMMLILSFMAINHLVSKLLNKVTSKHTPH
jgi:hypothetical protein